MDRDDERSLRQELAEVEGYLASLTERMARVQGYRDSLLLKLTDLEGADDQRFAGVR